ncbi:Glycerophosphocholine phosphodiesterase GDE1, partial [Frankliniella fusca]
SISFCISRERSPHVKRSRVLKTSRTDNFLTSSPYWESVREGKVVRKQERKKKESCQRYTMSLHVVSPNQRSLSSTVRSAIVATIFAG